MLLRRSWQLTDRQNCPGSIELARSLDFKEAKKRVGKLNYEVEPAEICIFKKREIKDTLKLRLKEAKSVKNLHCERKM